MYLPRFINKERCPSAKILGVYYLDSYELAYSKLSKDGSAKANIIPKKNAKTLGLLTSIENSELFALRKAEGCRSDGNQSNYNGYIERIVSIVSVETNNTIKAKTYISPSLKCKEIPFDWYFKHVVEGAKAYNFEYEYIENYLDVASKVDNDFERKTKEFAYSPRIKRQPFDTVNELIISKIIKQKPEDFEA